MGLEHMKTPPVTQGENQNYCWAASLSWWLKAVWNRTYSTDELIFIYGDWINEEEGPSLGALTPEGLNKVAFDQRWHFDFDTMKNDKLTVEYLGRVLARGPVIVAYYEPEVSGYHMNVIVAGAGLNDLVSGLVVMDPNYESFQIRTIQYYKNYYSKIVFLYKTALTGEPKYAYEQSY
jgi:hypothetical protein